MEAITKEELIEAREYIYNLVAVSEERRIALRLNGDITDQQFLILSNYESRLLGLAMILSTTIYQQILTDLEEPKDEIIKASKKLQKAIEKLKSFRDFLRALNLVIRIIDIVVDVIGGGAGVIASLAGIIDEIRDFESEL